MITAEEALVSLQEGNKRFVSGVRSIDSMIKQSARAEFVAGQAPFAIILGCSDSRAPAELLFDQGLGDLFVIRVAGNIVAPSQIGSVEFAVQQYGTPLVVVLGHSHCGAVTATLEELESPTNNQSTNLLSIVSRIRPTVKPLFDTELRKDPAKLLEQSIRANILAAVNHLSHGSPLLEEMVNTGALRIVGAEYSLETGVVEFVEGV